MFTRASLHLQTLDLLPELRIALSGMLEHDSALLRHPENQHWVGIIPALQLGLAASAVDVEEFACAWCLMYMATRRLDQLQDGDPIGDPILAAYPVGVQYNLVFSYYLLATSVLNQQLCAMAEPRRAMQVQALWNTTMLSMASGQQRDLVIRVADAAMAPLAAYQQIAQSKTGAAFALAFGGTALLCSDDEAVVAALMNAGEAYGALLQYSDDIADAREQPNATLTLPVALRSAQPDVEQDTVVLHDAFFSHVYCTYHDHVRAVLASIESTASDAILGLFHSTFGLPATSDSPAL